MGRDEQKKVGGAINPGELVLRHPAEEADTVGDIALPRRPLDRFSFGSFADNYEFEFRQPGQRFDHQLVALEGDKIADREQCPTGQAESLPRRVAIVRAESHEVDAIAQHPDPRGGNTELYQPLLQAARHGDQSVRPPRRPLDPPARDRMPCQDV